MWFYALHRLILILTFSFLPSWFLVPIPNQPTKTPGSIPTHIISHYETTGPPGPWRPLSAQGSQRPLPKFLLISTVLPKTLTRREDECELWRKSHFFFRHKVDFFVSLVASLRGCDTELSSFINHSTVKRRVKWKVIPRLFCFLGCGTFHLHPAWWAPFDLFSYLLPPGTWVS